MAITSMRVLEAYLLLGLLSSPSAFAANQAPPRCVPEQGTASAELAALAGATRTDDSFYRQLVKWQGPPSACKGSVGKGEAQGESSLTFTWPDGSTFEQSSLLPETSVVRYSNVHGLARADEITAAFRDYAARQGLHIDWTSPHQETESGERVSRFDDPAPGVNGIARFSYDRQQRLIGVSLSIAL